jgi:hypothetical protein
VNYEKSSIYFGRGCRQGDREALKQTVGITCEALSEKYLGLPTQVGRSKDGAFKYLPERPGISYVDGRDKGCQKKEEKS